MIWLIEVKWCISNCNYRYGVFKLHTQIYWKSIQSCPSINFVCNSKSIAKSRANYDSTCQVQWWITKIIVVLEWDKLLGALTIEILTCVLIWLKSSQNKKDLNDVTAALFWCIYFSCQHKKNTENRVAVKSLRSFLFCDDFSICFEKWIPIWFIANKQ